MGGAARGGGVRRRVYGLMLAFKLTNDPKSQPRQQIGKLICGLYDTLEWRKTLTRGIPTAIHFIPLLCSQHRRWVLTVQWIARLITNRGEASSVPISLAHSHKNQIVSRRCDDSSLLLKNTALGLWMTWSQSFYSLYHIRRIRKCLMYHKS